MQVDRFRPYRSRLPWRKFPFHCELLEDRRLLSAGDLDPTFGSGGVAAYQAAGNPASSANAIAILGNGEVAAVGGTAPAGSQYESDFSVARLTPNGALDASFNRTPIYDKHHHIIGYQGGTNSTSFGSTYEASATSLAVQADGKLVAAGDTSVSYWTNGNYAFALARYNADGTLDTSFNRKPVYDRHGHITGYTGGTVVTDLGPNRDMANAVAIYPAGDPNGNAGKIIAAGGSKQALGDFALVRYNADGTLDSGFGQGGVVLTPIGSSSRAYGEVIQPDGKVLAVGYAVGGYIALARYNADGSLDATFGSGGIETVDFGGYTQANTVELQNDGRIVVGGYINGQAGLARFTSAGTVDPTFGTSGIVLMPNAISPDSNDLPGVDALSIDPASGEITFAGSLDQNHGGGSGYNLLAGRVDASGNLDSSFAPGGYAINQVWWYGIGGAAIYPYDSGPNSGQILTAGINRNSAGTLEQALVGRFEGTPLPTAMVTASLTAQTAAPAVAAPARLAAADLALTAYEYPLVDDGALDALARGKS